MAGLRAQPVALGQQGFLARVGQSGRPAETALVSTADEVRGGANMVVVSIDDKTDEAINVIESEDGMNA